MAVEATRPSPSCKERSDIDGLLLIDKPSGPTSHDVVRRVRRLLDQPRIGHTGTLDPLASGLLPLVIGRATRLARFLSGSEKRYDAVVRLGIETTTCDSVGEAIGAPYEGPMPLFEAVDRALDPFRGTFVQQPPAFSAKKIGGRRSYRLARAGSSAADSVAPALPSPVTVTAYALDLRSVNGDQVELTVSCSAGFYVRALADDLGRQLGTGAHLTSLRRTHLGGLSVDDALPLESAEQNPHSAVARVIPLREMLPELPAATLSDTGVRHAVNGRGLAASDLVDGERPSAYPCRLMDPAGDLVGIGTEGRAPELLHPSIILR
jgi:tRNA pseudouridine55 synthase